MATDDERREVARMLRGLNGNVSHVRRVYEDEGFSILCDDQADYYQICHAVAGYLPAEHMHPCDYEELHARLADLIEPSESGQNRDRNQDSVQIESPAVQMAPECDREALLALAEELSGNILVVPAVYGTYQSGYVAACQDIARSIREACGEESA